MTDPKPDPKIPPLVSLKEAADMLGVVRQYAHRMAVRGQLRGRHVGGTWVFRRAHVEWIVAQRAKDKPAE